MSSNIDIDELRLLRRARDRMDREYSQPLHRDAARHDRRPSNTAGSRGDRRALALAYSWRSASRGSIVVARRAGRYTASMAMAANAAATAA